MKKRRNRNPSSGKHAKALSDVYWAEWHRLVPRFDAGELSFDELNREALKPGAEVLADIRRENLVPAREARARNRAAAQKARKAEADARFAEKERLRKMAKKTSG